MMINLLGFVMQALGTARIRSDESGASLVEYALLLALIAVVAIVALTFLGGSVTNAINSAGSSLNNP